MVKAYDAIFQEEVDASVVAKSLHRAYGDRFRYQCLCCGEEVYLAAADSIERSPHFRHRKGNNDTDCERYLGQPGVLESSVSMRKQNRERVGFGFNIDRMTFEICLYLTSDEIEAYAEKGELFYLYTKYYSTPFIEIPLNRSVIIPNTGNYYTVCEYSYDYYASFDCGNMKIAYPEVMKKGGKLNIYRANLRDEHYKRNATDILYTNTEYIAISEKEENIKELLVLQSIEVIGSDFSFTTIDKNFYAVRFKIKYIDYASGLYFKKHDLQMETSESMDILWPPIYMRDNAFVCSGNEVYITSSFKLIPHGNIDVGESEIEDYKDKVCKIAIEDKIIIHEKNVEALIVKETREGNECTQRDPIIMHIDKYVVPNEYDYFLFDKNGCTRLIEGSKIYLSQDDKIIGYKNGHIKAYIFACSRKKCSTEEILNEIVKYHSQLEPFNMDEFMDINSDEAIINYLERCYRCGMINSVAKRYIMEMKN